MKGAEGNPHPVFISLMSTTERERERERERRERMHFLSFLPMPHNTACREPKLERTFLCLFVRTFLCFFVFFLKKAVLIKRVLVTL